MLNGRGCLTVNTEKSVSNYFECYSVVRSEPSKSLKLSKREIEDAKGETRKMMIDWRQEFDSKFIGFTRTLPVTLSKYQELFKNIINLKCKYITTNAYSEPCHTYKTELFAKIFKQSSVKTHLRCLIVF